MSVNRYALALALTRRLDRLDAETRADAVRVIDAVEDSRPHTSLLKKFFPAAWARLGRAAAAASTPADRRAALAHLAVLSEIESVLGLTPATEPEQAAVEEPVPVSEPRENEHVTESDHEHAWGAR